MHFRKFLADEKSTWHEAGHIAIAMYFDKEVIIIADLQDKENGLAGISTAGFTTMRSTASASRGSWQRPRGRAAETWMSISRR
jgi:hypothetical protein